MEVLRQHLENLKGVGVVLIQNGKVLLGKRTDSQEWGLPGGGIEEGETPKEAAIRELFEEFSIINDELKYYGISVSPRNLFKASDSKEGCSIDFFYEYKENEIVDIHVELKEVEEFKWIPLDDVLLENLYPASRHSLEVFLRV